MKALLAKCIIRFSGKSFSLTAKAKGKIARALDSLPASYDFWSDPDRAVKLLAKEYDFPEEKKKMMAACMILTIYYT